jgi:rhodanese-related sulfurtransferase
MTPPLTTTARDPDPPEPGGRATLLGALVILVVGVVLGAVHNSFGLASKPPHGVSWIMGPEPAVPLPTVESAIGATSPPAAVPTTDPASAGAAADVPVIPDVPGPLSIELPTLKKLWDAGAVIMIDARDPSAYHAGHIQGATNLTLAEAMSQPERLKAIDAGGRPIAVYCSGTACGLSEEVAHVLIEAGKRRVLVFPGGFPAWQEAGYPVTTSPPAGAP